MSCHVSAPQIAVPTDRGNFSVQFDRRVSSPMGVAEALCDSPQLGLTSLAVSTRVCVRV